MEKTLLQNVTHFFLIFVCTDASNFVKSQLIYTTLMPNLTQCWSTVDTQWKKHYAHCLSRHFSKWNWVSRFLSKLRTMEVVVAPGAISRTKLQSNRHHQQTNSQPVYWPDVLPVVQPTVSKHWRSEKETLHWGCKFSRNLLFVEIFPKLLDTIKVALVNSTMQNTLKGN